MCTKLFSAFATVAVIAWGSIAAGSFSAQTFPAASFQTDGAEGGLTLVAEGCGPGRSRGPEGRCRRDGEVVVAPVVGPIVVEPGRVCPLGTHWAPRRRECVVN
jgi:hypothetical protein